MEAQMEANWFDGSEDELVQELLDNESPLFVLPPEIIEPVADSITNVYSGPRIEDIESALLITGQDIESNDGNIISQHGISILERGLSKIDNKYTLKIKSCGNGMADDGYKWRKYGQKSIKNSPYPRSYYRCTNPRCSAKKQMERSTEDPDMLIVTYEGLHLHFTYSHFLPTQPQHMYQYPPIKKPKKTHSPTETQHEQVVEAAQGEAQENPVIVEVEPLPPSPPIPPSPPSPPSPIILDYQEELCQGGLLEDVVPLMIRKPSFSNTSSNSSCSSSYPSSPPTSSSCSISWSPNFSSINVADGTL